MNYLLKVRYTTVPRLISVCNRMNYKYCLNTSSIIRLVFILGVSSFLNGFKCLILVTTPTLFFSLKFERRIRMCYSLPLTKVLTSYDQPLLSLRPFISHFKSWYPMTWSLLCCHLSFSLFSESTREESRNLRVSPVIDPSVRRRIIGLQSW